MSVNTMNIEQAYSLIAELHEQATGQKTIAPVDLSGFISIAQKTLAAGYDPVINAITQVLTRTIVAVRPYSRKFAGLEVTADRWGGIIRKLSFGDRDPEADTTYALVDGQSTDQFAVKKPIVLETRYVGSAVYEDSYTIFTRQLDVAFSNPAEFANFMAGLMEHYSNLWEQWLEEESRAIVSNFIAAKVADGDVVHLLTEYNTATGITPALTAITVRQPANWGPFVKWAYARIMGVARQMTERSQLFQHVVTGYKIMRHTPYADQKFYMMANFLESMNAEVLADTYHENMLRFADVESVGYWQAIENPDQIQVTPAVLANNGLADVGSAATLTNVLGVLFDRDAIGYNIYQNEIVNSPYQAKDQYYNVFHHGRLQLQNDLTEKGVVFCLD